MSADRAGHGVAGVAVAGAFLARLCRLDPAALVRLRPAPRGSVPVGVGGESPPGGRVELWARLPWGVLVGRTVAGPGPASDATVAAAAFLNELAQGGSALPPRRDAQWRWQLPAHPGTAVERLPGTELRRLATAAATALRTAATEGVAGRAVGERVLRDALLDHVAVVVTPRPPVDPVRPGRPVGLSSDRSATDPAEPVEIPQRLVQAVVRMGFLPSAGPAGRDVAQVRLNGRWVGLSAPFGVAWLPKAINLMVGARWYPPKG